MTTKIERTKFMEVENHPSREVVLKLYKLGDRKNKFEVVGEYIDLLHSITAQIHSQMKNEYENQFELENGFFETDQVAQLKEEFDELVDVIHRTSDQVFRRYHFILKEGICKRKQNDRYDLEPGSPHSIARFRGKPKTSNAQNDGEVE